MSSTKPVAAVCFHMLVDRGQVSYDDPIDRYWPEFAQNGNKAGYPIRYILDHRIGLPLIPQSMWPETVRLGRDGRRTCGRAAPWEPGTNAGYHVRTYGFLLGEVFRRIEGRTIGQFLRDEISVPLISITGSACHPASTGDEPPNSSTRDVADDAALDQQSLLARASPAVPRDMFNSPAWMSAEFAGVERPRQCAVAVAILCDPRQWRGDERQGVAVSRTSGLRRRFNTRSMRSSWIEPTARRLASSIVHRRLS